MREIVNILGNIADCKVNVENKADNIHSQDKLKTLLKFRKIDPAFSGCAEIMPLF